MSRTLSPLAEPFPPDVAALLENYPRQGGYLLRLFRVFANSRRFLAKGVLNLLDKESPLVIRERELVILRVCALNDCEYEWGVHVAAFGKAAGLSDEQIAATRGEHAQPDCWSPKEALLLRAVDELCRHKRITPYTYAEVQQHWTVQEQLEILALCGNYHTVCFVANTAALEPEAFAARFPR